MEITRKYVRVRPENQRATVNLLDEPATPINVVSLPAQDKKTVQIDVSIAYIFPVMPSKVLNI